MAKKKQRKTRKIDRLTKSPKWYWFQVHLIDGTVTNDHQFLTPTGAQVRGEMLTAYTPNLDVIYIIDGSVKEEDLEVLPHGDLIVDRFEPRKFQECGKDSIEMNVSKILLGV